MNKYVSLKITNLLTSTLKFEDNGDSQGNLHVIDTDLPSQSALWSSIITEII